MPIEQMTVNNEGPSFTYCSEVADNEDAAQMDFLYYLLEM